MARLAAARARNLNKVESELLPRHALPERAPCRASRSCAGRGGPSVTRTRAAPVELGTGSLLLRVQGALHARALLTTTRCARACGDLNHRKRTRAVRPLRGARRARDRRARQDRAADRAQAAALRRARDRDARASRPTRRAATPRCRSSSEFAGRLEIHGLDLRHTPSVERLCARPPGLARRGSTSSSTTPARPCAGRRRSTRT